MNGRKSRISLMAMVAPVILLVALLSGCGGKDTASTSDQEQAEIRPTNVVVLKAVPETVEEVFTLPGTLEAWEDLTLSLEQSGPIRWIGPKEGDRLRSGEHILRIDTATLQSQHDKDQTEYDLKKRNLERVKSLLEEELVSQKQYDDARLTYESAKAKLTQSRIALKKSTLASPIDGILDRLLVDRGEYGTVGVPAAVVVQVDRLKVLVDVPEKDVTAIDVGKVVQVLAAEVNGADGMGRDGKVIHVSYQADEMTRTYRTKIEIDNSNGLLRPGMIVRVRFVRRTIHDVLLVSLYAVIDRDGEKHVFVVENDSAVERQVRLGPVINGKVVVFGGIQEGEDLVVKGQQLLSDGNPVRIVGN